MCVTQPRGFLAAGGTAGIKPSGKPDVCLIVREPAPAGAVAGFAAAFTGNAVVGAPVEIGLMQRAAALVPGGRVPRAVLINAGNSNAATGEQGVRDARACMVAAAGLLGCAEMDVVPSSTGVIGRPLPVIKIVGALPGLFAALARGERADADASRAIMTTDLVPKAVGVEVSLSGGDGGGARVVRIGAIAKGSGMIAPRLEMAFSGAARAAAPTATMLAFVTTDAPIASRTLQVMLDRAGQVSFNRVSVDNHPSCSDTAIVLASGHAGGAAIVAGTPEHAAFEAALTGVCERLAEMIVADGEGATRVFRATVIGAPSDAAAELMARQIVDSPLVKCAIHGKDPNWGRIVTAAGNAGVRFDPRQASLTIGPVEVYRAGVPITEALSDPRLVKAMGGARVELVLTVGAGPGRAWMMGCDLSKDYVSINADYTT